MKKAIQSSSFSLPNKLKTLTQNQFPFHKSIWTEYVWIIYQETLFTTLSLSFSISLFFFLFFVFFFFGLPWILLCFRPVIFTGCLLDKLCLWTCYWVSLFQRLLHRVYQGKDNSSSILITLCFILIITYIQWQFQN